MKTFVAKFWRGNPQLSDGGYETTRRVEARTLKSAIKKAEKIPGNIVYGTMTLISVEEERSL